MRILNIFFLSFLVSGSKFFLGVDLHKVPILQPLAAEFPIRALSRVIECLSVY